MHWRSISYWSSAYFCRLTFKPLRLSLFIGGLILLPGALLNAQSAGGSTGSSIVFIHLLLLMLAAGLWVLFRDLIGQCFVAVFNDNVMAQLYRRRSGGQVSALLLCYVFFFLAAGLYVQLFLASYGYRVEMNIWLAWLTYSLGVAAGLGVKLLIITLLGRVYPSLRKELSQYAFLLMVFSILTGLLLVPLNLLVSYAPPEWRTFCLMGGTILLVVIYLLHLLRGLFVANRYMSSRPLHFLLYLCAIEIAPILLIYRYLSTTL